MTEHIRDLLQTLPGHPGVYIMRDGEGLVIYVGKAVSLKNRVRQYFHGQHAPKVAAMVEHIASFDYILTDSELEAFILECNLIKEHRPRYNILLKDDKHYPYIRIDLKQDFPRVEITRRMKRDGARYFGPYFSSRAVQAALEAVKRAFPVRTCRKDLKAAAARGERPCLNAHIGRCMAPCTGKVTRAEYHAVIRQVCRFLEGRSDEVLQELRRDMQEASAALQFEKAALYRDRISAIERVTATQQKAISTHREDCDVIGLYREGADAMMQLLVQRGGRVVGSDSFSLSGAQDEGDEELVRSFLQRTYLQAAVVPGVILVPALPHDLEAMEQWLGGLRGGRVHVHKPERGDKRKLVDMASLNARQALERQRLVQQRQWERTGGALEDLARQLGLDKPPQRMECYDISNTMGAYSVASMVVFEDGKPARKQYRRFRIKTVEGPNDFASMAEVITRRFTHGLAERQELAQAGKNFVEGRFSRFPDLVIIDGGPGQLSYAREVMEALGVGHIATVGLAKQEELLFKPGVEQPVRIDHASPTLHLVQHIRDEAHRFAITYHRSLRANGALVSRLDGIPGIGPARRKALLKAYPRKEMLEAATEEQLAALPGMNQNAARAVYEALHAPKEEG